MPLQPEEKLKLGHWSFFGFQAVIDHNMQSLFVQPFRFQPVLDGNGLQIDRGRRFEHPVAHHSFHDG
jgi:hypothetical protein